MPPDPDYFIGAAVPYLSLEAVAAGMSEQIEIQLRKPFNHRFREVPSFLRCILYVLGIEIINCLFFNILTF